jgi:ankyrin repeat protein
MEDGRTALQRAIEAGDLEKVKALIKSGENVNGTGPAGKTLVHVAGELGHADILSELIRAGAKVDEASEEGMRPLDTAASGTIAERLIAAGAKICHEPESPFAPAATPLVFAAIEGRADVVRILLKHKAEIKKGELADSLPWAAYAGRLEVVRVLLEDGVGPNPTNASRNESALHVAAQGGIADVESPEHVTPELRLKIAQLLIEKGADVNGKAQQGWSMDSRPLRGASTSGSVDIVRLLLDKGAEVNASSTTGMFFGRTALHDASEAGHVDVVKLLLERTATVNALTG